MDVIHQINSTSSISAKELYQAAAVVFELPALEEFHQYSDQRMKWYKDAFRGSSNHPPSFIQDEMRDYIKRRTILIQRYGFRGHPWWMTTFWEEHRYRTYPMNAFVRMCRRIEKFDRRNMLLRRCEIIFPGGSQDPENLKAMEILKIIEPLQTGVDVLRGARATEWKTQGIVIDESPTYYD